MRVKWSRLTFKTIPLTFDFNPSDRNALEKAWRTGPTEPRGHEGHVISPDGYCWTCEKWLKP